jgi:hypothetical protein
MVVLTLITIFIVQEMLQNLLDEATLMLFLLELYTPTLEMTLPMFIEINPPQFNKNYYNNITI